MIAAGIQSFIIIKNKYVMTKITVLKEQKDSDFLGVLSTVADAMKSLNEEQKQIYIKGFMFGRSGAVEITDEEIEKLLYGEHMEINAAKDFNKGVLSCWNYIKLRINQ